MSVTDRLAAFATGLGERDPPVEARHHARRVVTDWYAAALPGSVAPPATLLREALAEEIGRGAASLLPAARPAPPRLAALVNGAAAHAVEFDDIYREAVYHPGAPVVAAALALAEARDAPAERFLRAVVAGYEVSNRIGRAVMPGHYRFWHTTGTVGGFGAATAAGVVMGLEAGALGHALASVATMAAGIQQAFRSAAMSKPLHAGRAAEAGVLCALGAERGLTGARNMLEGERGFAAAMASGADWEAALSDLGRDWTITRTTQKNHGCCGHAFAALDALLALRAEHGLAPDDVAAVEVGTYAAALEVIGDPRPETPYQARFSLPYCAAVALALGSVRLAAFEPARLADPALRDLAGRVRMHVDPEAEAAFPRRRSARVAVETRDGRRLEARADTRRGDPEAPLTDAEIEDKYRELAAPVVGERAAAALLERIRGLETPGRPVRALAETLRGAAAEAAE